MSRAFAGATAIAHAGGGFRGLRASVSQRKAVLTEHSTTLARCSMLVFPSQTGGRLRAACAHPIIGEFLAGSKSAMFHPSLPFGSRMTYPLFAGIRAHSRWNSFRREWPQISANDRE